MKIYEKSVNKLNRMRKPTLNVQTDSIRAKVFVWAVYCNFSAYLVLFLICMRFN